MSVSTKAQQIEHLLRSFVTSTPEVHGAALVSLDGLPLYTALPAGTEEDRIAAMAAALLALGERTLRELRRGQLEQVYVKGSDGYIIVFRVGAEAVLEVITSNQAKLGLILLEAKRCAQEASRLI
ncbi:MAG: roadblock/LC7 domain-containing protein [Acidobacteria bacterium]|nr:roadblock/LC7 domain-containing protein [Acidobacteriota bacterium]MDW7984764.1 roadblock/LC7 domain-containing protein [Acidobacteriota bacterium]